MANQPFPNNAGYVGELDGTSGNDEVNAQTFLIQQILSRVSTATLVKVVAVTNDGGVAPVGFVDVHPLVNMLDGLGNKTAHGVIYNLPYFRLQGGANAVILDPKVNDIGIVIFADRDISSVKATKAQANPGSRRRFDMADGVYIGGVLNGTPQNYVRFDGEDGIEVSALNVKVHARRSYAHDVNGYGDRLTFIGGNVYQQDTYTTGAVVNSTEHGWHPPEIP